MNLIMIKTGNEREVSFTIPGVIGGKGRARAGKHGHYTPAKTRADEAVVRAFAHEGMVKAGLRELAGPLVLEVFVTKRFPQSWSRKRRAATYWITGKPDCDNQLKLLCDAMNGICYRDDSQIAAVKFSRAYGLPECIFVSLKELAPIP